MSCRISSTGNFCVHAITCSNSLRACGASLPFAYVRPAYRCAQASLRTVTALARLASTCFFASSIASPKTAYASEKRFALPSARPSSTSASTPSGCKATSFWSASICTSDWLRRPATNAMPDSASSSLAFSATASRYASSAFAHSSRSRAASPFSRANSSFESSPVVAIASAEIALSRIADSSTRVRKRSVELPFAASLSSSRFSAFWIAASTVLA